MTTFDAVAMSRRWRRCFDSVVKSRKRRKLSQRKVNADNAVKFRRRRISLDDDGQIEKTQVCPDGRKVKQITQMFKPTVQQQSQKRAVSIMLVAPSDVRHSTITNFHAKRLQSEWPAPRVSCVKCWMSKQTVILCFLTFVDRAAQTDDRRTCSSVCGCRCRANFRVITWKL